MINNFSDVEFNRETGCAAAIDVAKAQPGGWVYDIDRQYPADQPVPPEAIKGAWKVDAQGSVSDYYEKNSRYRAVEKPGRTLKPYMHAAARTNRNQWIVEIDPRGESLFPAIPPQLVRGWWFVDEGGFINGEFRPNSQWEEGGFDQK